MIEDRYDFIDGIGIWLDADLIGEILADSGDCDIFLGGSLVDDLHTDTKDGFGSSCH